MIKFFLRLKIFIFFTSFNLQANVSINILSETKNLLTVPSLAGEVRRRTSIDMKDTVTYYNNIELLTRSEAWTWVKNTDMLLNQKKKLDQRMVQWIKRGGLLVIEEAKSFIDLQKMTQGQFQESKNRGRWNVIPVDHALMRSFYLLKSLPTCFKEEVWYGFYFDKRLAILTSPLSFLSMLETNKKPSNCQEEISKETLSRVFINIIMVALTTDYKTDQKRYIPEIRKRLN